MPHATTGERADSLQNYWAQRIHDETITRQPPGTPQFFSDLADYRYDKLRYLPGLVDFDAHRGKSVLEVGCGIGIDLARFANAGAYVTGVDLSCKAIALAGLHLAQCRLHGRLALMDGEKLGFESNTFDVGYAHGVLPYTPDPAAMVRELHRVLRPGGQAIVMSYNRHSWLNALSRVTRVALEHADAPVFNRHSISEFRRLLQPFSAVRIVLERFPVATRLQHGWKARLYNALFVRAFNSVPRPLTQRLGWHIVALAVK